MEFIMEFIVELILETSIELGTDRKIPKWVRYPCILVAVLFFSFVIFVLVFKGIDLLEENIYASMIFLSVAVFLSAGITWKLRNVYKKKKKKQK